MISFKLSKKQESLREKFHEIAKTQLRPLLFELDQRAPGPVDPRFFEISAKCNLNALIIPSEYGGKPVDNITLSIIIEELAWGSPDFAAFFQATLHAVKTLLIGGSEEQKKKYLSLLLKSEVGCAAFGHTEEKGGSDSSSFFTNACLDKDCYILNGKKTPVINAGDALFYIVWASMATDNGRSGINAFIVPADSNGLTCGPHFDTSGYRGIPISYVSFDNVKIPRENMLGIPGSGYVLLMQAVDFARAFVGAACVGIARAAIDEALEYAKTRIIKNRPIARNQGVSFILSELITQLEASRMLVWKACELIDSALDYTVTSSMAKLIASELAVRATSDGILIMGQKCLTRSSLMEKLQRDAQFKRIIDGTSQIQKAIIANQF